MMYTFESLSPIDFEDLSRDLLQAELSVTLESFKPGSDAGIDLRHSRDPSSSIVVQCKHWRKSGATALKTHLRSSELSKVKKLSPQRYILVTSVELSPGDKNAIKSAFRPYIQTFQDIMGAGDVNGLLTKYPDIERRHFKLWLASTEALTRFLNSATTTRSSALVARAQKRLQLYANNESFDRALQMLEDKHVCIVAGAPGIGKTTLADVLMIHHLEQGYEVIDVSSDIDEANASIRAAERQFFYYDDFLGTAFDEQLPKNEDSRLLQFLKRIEESSNKRIVLTSREYILKAASLRYENIASSSSYDRTCVVSLEDYTRRARAKILYNHVYFSGVSRDAREALLHEARYESLIDHPNFSPRLIEHGVEFAEKGRTEHSNFPDFLREVLDNPQRVWDHAFQYHLPESAQSVLLTLLFLPQRPYIDDLRRAASSLCERRHGGKISTPEMQRQLKVLEGTFLRIDRASPISVLRTVVFETPAINDYLLSIVDGSEELVVEILKSTTYFEQLVNIARAAATEEDGHPRYPGFLHSVRSNAALLAARLREKQSSETCVPRRWVHGALKYESQPTIDRRIHDTARVAQLLDAEPLVQLVDELVEESASSWSQHLGDRSAVADIFGLRGIQEVQKSELAAWAAEDLQYEEDFELAAALISEDGVEFEYYDYVASAFEALVESQYDYIMGTLISADDAKAARDSVNELADKLGFMPKWDEQELDRRIKDLQAPEAEDDFDYERARSSHPGGRSDSFMPSGEIAALFSTLLDEPSDAG